MTIEGISTPVMTYQGSVSAPETTVQKPIEQAEKANTEAVTIRQSADGQVIAKNQKDEKTKDDGSQNNPAANEALKKAVEEINKNLQNSEAIFGIHDKTNRVMIKIVDKESKEVIKEFPPEQTLDMIAKVWEMAGIMVDEKR